MPTVENVVVSFSPGCEGANVDLGFLDGAGDPIGGDWSGVVVGGLATMTSNGGSVPVVPIEAVTLEIASTDDPPPSPDPSAGDDPDVLPSIEGPPGDGVTGGVGDVSLAFTGVSLATHLLCAVLLTRCGALLVAATRRRRAQRAV